jgi:glycosyltransferase involved in cell wall biosynthesis
MRVDREPMMIVGQERNATGPPRGRRIAHVTDCYLPRMGGIERQVAGLAAAQLADGDEVHVFTTVADDSAAQHVPPSAIVHRPEVVGGTIGRIHYRRSRQVQQLLDAGQFDLIHAHVSTFSPLAFREASAARTHSTPTIVTLHSMLAGARTALAIADGATSWSRWPVTWSAVSTKAASDLQPYLADRLIEVLPNGVDAAFWRSGNSGSTVVDGLTIATVMRLVARKRPLQFVEMLARLRRSVPSSVPISARIIGDGPMRRKVADLIVRHDLQRWVDLEGQLPSDAIRSVFATSNLYVAPAVHESFGIAALEAHSAGLPVLAFANSGVSDIVRDGVDGRLVAGDKDMVAAMAALAVRPNDLARLAVAAAGSEPRFDWTSVRQRANALYASAAIRAGVAS